MKLDKYHAHEALHVSRVLQNLVSTEMENHPFVMANPDIHAQVGRIQTQLGDLYQAIGQLNFVSDVRKQNKKSNAAVSRALRYWAIYSDNCLQEWTLLNMKAFSKLVELEPENHGKEPLHINDYDLRTFALLVAEHYESEIV
jgi:hypothetical protein